MKTRIVRLSLALCALCSLGLLLWYYPRYSAITTLVGSRFNVFSTDAQGGKGVIFRAHVIGSLTFAPPAVTDRNELLFLMTAPFLRLETVYIRNQDWATLDNTWHSLRWFRTEVKSINAGFCTFRPQDLQSIAGFSKLHHLRLPCSNVLSHEDMVHIWNLPSIEELELEHPGKDHLVGLEECESLRTVIFEGAEVSLDDLWDVLYPCNVRFLHVRQVDGKLDVTAILRQPAKPREIYIVSQSLSAALIDQLCKTPIDKLSLESCTLPHDGHLKLAQSHSIGKIEIVDGDHESD